jgi:hypothetical protein
VAELPKPESFSEIARQRGTDAPSASPHYKAFSLDNCGKKIKTGDLYGSPVEMLFAGVPIAAAVARP